MNKKDIEIENLKKQLKIATRILNYYGNIDIWRYRGVKKETKKSHIKTYYTSFESVPIKDGWKWAQEALKDIERIDNEENRES